MQNWSSISAFRKKLKIISYFQRFLQNFFTFYPKNPKRPNRQSANMAHFVAFCIGFQKNIPLQNPPGGRGIYGSSRSIHYAKWTVRIQSYASKSPQVDEFAHIGINYIYEWHSVFLSLCFYSKKYHTDLRRMYYISSNIIDVHKVLAVFTGNKFFCMFFSIPLIYWNTADLVLHWHWNYLPEKSFLGLRK